MSEQSFWTIGHSTHTQQQLVELLHKNSIKVLVDVRTVPRSSRNPQFNKDTLTAVLPQQHNIQYVWMGKELGGLRKRNKDLHVNEGWENLSFRGYADYMQTPAFKDGIQQLMQLAETEGAVAIMCAEAVYFSCHRRLISDALTVSGWQVWHIMPDVNRQPALHAITRFAHVEGDTITYPPGEAAARVTRKKKQKTESQQPPAGKFSTAAAAAEDRSQGQAENAPAAAAGLAVGDAVLDQHPAVAAAAVGDNSVASRTRSHKQLKIDGMMVGQQPSARGRKQQR